jgi:uncharacterized protein YjiS (DUF1127 family)
MPTIACPCAYAPGHRPTLTDRVRAFVRKIAVAVAVRAERRALMSLDQAALKDLGFNSGQAYREHCKSFWDIPHDRPRT